MKRFRNGESGQSIVVIAVAVTVMMAMLALVLDVGFSLAQRRFMQNGADAAAVAGSRALAERADNTAATEQAILRQINFYAEQNRVPDTNGIAGDATNTNVRAYFVDGSNAVVGGRIGTNGGVPSGASRVLVETKELHGTFFAPAIGIPTATTKAVAQARFETAGAATGCAPIALLDFDFQFGQTYTMWDGSKSENPSDPTLIPGGNRGWIRFTGYAGANDLRWLMDNGYPGTVRVGDVLAGEPGVKNGVFQNAPSWIGREFIIPIYDVIVSGGYRIVAFAAFIVTSYEVHGNDSAIHGTFQRRILGTAGGGTRDWGVGTVRLVPPATLP